MISDAAHSWETVRGVGIVVISSHRPCRSLVETIKRFVYAPLNDPVGGQRLVPFHLNRAGGQADGPRRGLQRRGRSQGSELSYWSLAAALPHVKKNRHLKERPGTFSPPFDRNNVITLDQGRGQSSTDRLTW